MMTARQGMTRRRLVGAIGAGMALSAFARSPGADALDGLIRDRMAAAHIPGLALGIARAGRTVFARGYGFADLAQRRPVTRDTMFHIASITKTVTATMVMQLAERGRIDLDARVAPHLDFAIRGDPDGAITFRQLLMHSSGISDDTYYRIDFRTPGRDATMPLGTLVRDYLAPGGRYTGDGNVRTPPGSAWNYSNIGYALLGYLAGRIAGEDMRGFARAHLFRPLGLGHAAWTIADTPAPLRATPYDLAGTAPKPVPPIGAPDWPASMLHASVADLSLLAGAAANGGVANGVRLLGAATNAEMLAMHRLPGLPDWLTGQGLAWQQSPLGGVPRANHWGGDPGVFTMAYLDPERRTAVVLLSNLTATPEAKAALQAIAAAAFTAGCAAADAKL